MNRKLFAYFNIDHPMVAWEVAIGRIKSICDRNEDKFGVSLWFYGLMEKYIKDASSTSVINEFKLELVRQNIFPEKVSRLQGVYFFESKYLAETALDRWGLSHRKKYISEVYFSGNSYTEVDSEWITSYLKSDDIEWMPKYWSGETLGVKPLTEIIASGIGIIHNNELRSLAYQRVIEKWPTTSILLNACIATFSESKIEDVGLSVPALLNKSGKLEGCYYIRMKSFDENQHIVVDSLQKAAVKGMDLPNILPSDKDKIFSLPDLTDLKIQLDNEQVSDIFETVHS